MLITHRVLWADDEDKKETYVQYDVQDGVNLDQAIHDATIDFIIATINLMVASRMASVRALISSCNFAFSCRSALRSASRWVNSCRLTQRA